MISTFSVLVRGFRHNRNTPIAHSTIQAHLAVFQVPGTYNTVCTTAHLCTRCSCKSLIVISFCTFNHEKMKNNIVDNIRVSSDRNPREWNTYESHSSFKTKFKASATTCTTGKTIFQGRKVAWILASQTFTSLWTSWLLDSKSNIYKSLTLLLYGLGSWCRLQWRRWAPKCRYEQLNI